MGATSAFNFGMGFGMWIATCAALEIPYQLVHPATWKAALMRDQGKEKDASRVKAMQLYPYTAKDLARKKDHARGDALLLAHYGLMFSSGARPEKVRRPVVERLPNDTPLLFGGSSVQLPKQRTVVAHGGYGGRGKRGGGRAIYFLMLADDVAVMLFAYGKSTQEDLTQEQKRGALATVKEITDGEL